MHLFVFTRYFYNRFDDAVSITVALKELDNKVEGSNPSKTLFFAFANMQEIFRDLHFCRKTCFDVLCTCKAIQLLLKAWTSSAWRKRSLEGNCHCIVYGTGLQHSRALADLPLRKLWKRRRRHRANSNNQSNHRHLR